MLKKFFAISLGAKLMLFSLLLVAFSFLCYLTFYVTDNGGGVSNIRISNVTANSVTISWITDTPSIGKVYISSSDNWPVLVERIGKAAYYDDRDTAQNHEGSFVLKNEAPVDRLTHHVTVRNLSPETTYYFKAGGAVRLFGNGGDNFKTIRGKASFSS